MDVQTSERTFETHFIRLTQRSQPKKLKPGLVASYDMRLANRVGLFWWNGKGCKSKKIDEASEKGKSKRY